MTRSSQHKIDQLFYKRFYGVVLWRSTEEQAWLEATPVGREFGSPDHHRLNNSMVMRLTHLAI